MVAYKPRQRSVKWCRPLSTLNVIAGFIYDCLQAFRHPAPQVRQVIDESQYKVLSSAEISRYHPFTRYAGAAYCPPEMVLAWSCGPTCDAVSFKPVDAGGDGSSVQYWYVGYDTSLKTVIVAHQGTNPAKLLSILTDVKIKMVSLNNTYFPGLPLPIRVHVGFSGEHLVTAASIFFAVKKAMALSGYKDVTIVGHSLGAALALLDGVYLPIFIPNAHYSLITFGMPRVGNEDFANYVDLNMNLTRITNKKDPVPIVPGRDEGYSHPQGERHIHLDGTWIHCPGQDNPDPRCTTADVPSVNDGNASDHNGPYDGILTDCHTNVTST